MATPDPYKAGGWWCASPRCQRFVEPDTDSREVPVCPRCHRARLRYHYPGRQDGRQTVMVAGERLSIEAAHAFFETMRAVAS